MQATFQLKEIEMDIQKICDGDHVRQGDTDSVSEHEHWPKNYVHDCACIEKIASRTINSVTMSLTHFVCASREEDAITTGNQFDMKQSRA